MLKWLVTGESETTDIHNKITEDPLATIKIGKQKKNDKIYSVNRFNPLFEEEIKKRNDTTKDVTDNETGDHDTISTTSSGYGSNSTQKGQMKEKAEEKSSETGETKKEEVNARVIHPKSCVASRECSDRKWIPRDEDTIRQW